mmetsp:Transcript_20052/g.56845  ORF Transcript_20052/g.56845 Transcript_20052/m.56845 type:complete len:164 (-) Transcript_20052:104-595(-)
MPFNQQFQASNNWLAASPQPPAQTSKHIRRARNRVHAQKSRLRKKDITQSLEETIRALKTNNTKLKEFISRSTKTQKEKRWIAKRIQASSSTDCFIESIRRQKPLGSSTISFLRGLRDGIAVVVESNSTTKPSSSSSEQEQEQASNEETKQEQEGGGYIQMVG